MFDREIENLRLNGLYREIRDRESPAGRIIRIDGQDYLNFASNDYLGLSFHDEIIQAAIDSVRTYGMGAGSSRLLSGGTELFRELEQDLARLKGTEDALVFNSGYALNTGVIPAIAGRGDVIFSDEINHASIIDGCRLSAARKVIYPHCDAGKLGELLRRERSRRKLVVTESVFSMDGDIAPLEDIFSLCESSNAILYVDDAHATGVLGDGRGSLTHFNLPAAPFVIQMGTLSKAFGAAGAFIAAGRSTCRYFINTARTIMFSTALPPPVIAAALKAVQIITKSPDLIDKLWKKIHLFHRGIESLGIKKGKSVTQILPILCEDVAEATKLSDFLFYEGIYAPAIRPPAVIQPRIRISLTASHSRDDIELLLDLLGRFFGGR